MGRETPRGGRATEEELVKEVELTRAFFSEVRGKYTEQTDRVIEQMEGMLYGEEGKASLVDPDAHWGYKDEDHPFCCDPLSLISFNSSPSPLWELPFKTHL